MSLTNTWWLRGVLIGCSAHVLSVIACSGPETVDETLARSRPQAILFGADDRAEPFNLAAGSLGARIADTSVALMTASNLDVTDPANVQIIAETQVQRFAVCADERFATQLSAANCSGTLLAPDLVLTAGHCIDDVSCAAGQLRIVSGYRMKDDTSLAPLTVDDIFTCSRVVAREFSSNVDFAVVRLDRPVPGAPLPQVKVGPLPLAPGQHLVVAGYPEGMPEKVADNAVVIDPRTRTTDFFTADIDSFPGDSGAGVFVEETGELAGVLVRGPNPGYVVSPGEACTRPEHATTASDATLIASTYVHHAIDALCAAEPDPRLCACGNGVCEPALEESTATCPQDCGSRCGDGACNGPETSDTCYGDCGYCGNGMCDLDEIARMSCPADCGCPPGLNVVAGVCVPVRGNTNGDDRIDRQDVVALRESLMDRGASAIHLLAADVDCNGLVDGRDASALDAFVRGHSLHLPCETVSSIAAGFQHTCALTVSGRVRCWGDDTLGQLGIGTSMSPGISGASVAPAGAYPLVDLGAPALAISTGATHSCALLVGGAVMCWGDGSDGKLGYGNIHNVGDDETPRSVGAVELGEPAVAVAAGGSHSCAILQSGAVRCWGANLFGQLGYGGPDSIGDDELPTAVSPLRFPEAATALALGFDHSCAVTASGSVYCWGENFFGQLGRGTPDGGGPFERADATPPISIGGAARGIAAGVFTTCAVRQDGAAYCWGDNSSGQLGNGTFDTIGDDESPVDGGAVVGGASADRLALGLGETCALYTGGDVKCWGSNTNGQLGYGTDAALETTPAALDAVPIGDRVGGIAMTSSHTCVVVSQGSVRCWGDGASGKLGYGDTRSIGAGTTPQSVGIVPLEPIPTPGWRYNNPQNVEVWMRQVVGPDRLHDGRASEVEIYLLNPGGTPGSGLRAFYDFFLGPDEPAAVSLDATAGRGWDVSLEAYTGGFHSAVLSGTSGVAGVGLAAFATAHARIRFVPNAGSDARWDWQNDYSSADRPASSTWFPSQRVQVVDDQSNVVSGWTPR